MNSHSAFSKLPLDLLLEICSYLSLKDINNIHSLNKGKTLFNEITAANKSYPQLSNKLWEQKLKQHFLHDYEQIIEKHKSHDLLPTGYWYSEFKRVYDKNYGFLKADEKKIYNLVKEGNPEDIIKLIKQDILKILNLSKHDRCFGDTPLLTILQKNNQDVLDTLYAHSKEAIEKFKCSKLEWAIICNQNQAVIDSLITLNPLQSAHVIKYHDNDLYSFSRQSNMAVGKSIIRVAIQFNRIDAINSYLEHANIIPAYTSELLKYAIRYNRVNLVKIFLDKHDEVEKTSTTEFSITGYEQLVLEIIRSYSTNLSASNREIISILNERFTQNIKITEDVLIKILSVAIQYGNQEIVSLFLNNHAALMTKECMQNILKDLCQYNVTYLTNSSKQAFLALLNHNPKISKEWLAEIAKADDTNASSNRHRTHIEIISLYIKVNDAKDWQRYIYELIAKRYSSDKDKMTNSQPSSEPLINYALQFEQPKETIMALAIAQKNKTDGPLRLQLTAFSHERWDLVEILLKDRDIDYWVEYLKIAFYNHSKLTGKGLQEFISLLKNRFHANTIQENLTAIYSNIIRILANDKIDRKAYIHIVLKEFPDILVSTNTHEKTRLYQLITPYGILNIDAAEQIFQHLDGQLSQQAKEKNKSVELQGLKLSLFMTIREIISANYSDAPWSSVNEKMAHNFWLLYEKHFGTPEKSFNKLINTYIHPQTKYNGLMKVILDARLNDIKYDDIKHMVTKESVNYQLNYPGESISSKCGHQGFKAMDFALCLPHDKKIRAPLIKAILNLNEPLKALYNKETRNSLLANNEKIPAELCFKIVPYDTTESLVIKLIDYIFSRYQEEQDIAQVKLFNRLTIYKSKYKKEQKIDAAAALLKYWLSDTPDTSILTEHLGALTDGRLGKMVSEYKIPVIMDYKKQPKNSTLKPDKPFKG